MNAKYFKCLIDSKTILEAYVIGLITLILGIIFIKISENKAEKKEKHNSKLKIYISLFLIGFFLHFIIQIIGLDDWYCGKKCMRNIKIISNL